MQDEVELQAPRPFPHQGSFWTTYWSTPEKTNLLASEVTPRADEERCVYCRDNDIDVCWQIRGGVVCLECKFAKRRCADCYGRRPHANDADQWFTSELDYLRVAENPHKLVKDILDKLPPAERERAKDEFNQFPRYARKQGDHDAAKNGSNTPAVHSTPVKRAATPTLTATTPHLTASTSTSTSTKPAVASVAKAKDRDVGPQGFKRSTNGNGIKRSTTPEGSPPPYDPRKMGLIVNADRPSAAKKRRVAPPPIQVPSAPVRSTTPEGTPPPWPPAGWIPRIKRSTTPPGSPPAHWPWPSVIATRRINYNIPASSKARVIRAQRFCEKMRDVLDKVDKEPNTDTDSLLTAIGRLGIGFGFGYHETFKKGGVLDEWWNGEQPDSPHRLIYARINPENSRDIGIAAPRKFNLTRAVSEVKAPRKRKSSAAKAAAGSSAPVGVPASTTPPGSPTLIPLPVYTPFILSSALASSASSTPTPDESKVAAAAKPAVNGNAAVSVIVPSKRKASASGGKTQPLHTSGTNGKPMAPAAAKIASVIKNIPAASTSKFAAPHQILAASKRATKKTTPTAKHSTQLAAGEHTPARTATSKLAASTGGNSDISTPIPAAPAEVATPASVPAASPAPTPVSTSAPRPAPPPESSFSFAAAPPKGSLKLGTSTNSALAAASSVTRGTPTSAHKSARRI
ncbi:BZ3500_MvSof-1268-A1-R1_Chr2-2g04940 [Microbotryum saponariae]|uniref:BZ3500_MvSof-1268-A1-R1_Chr2-2g04940 protein n=1 Tax=Microbotryum saponariae TaxID=289078 RepID=A0A2X0M780_9BASI|nr:BZ3500_MvSof-1268-A1-R1_Chr2-2g04940 [Microbotryum saponariae]SDA00524.1 BZ3501_MvSof-1269-A2-R1_Chr2-2g04614 [Microbotryum saponariae]